MGQKLDYLTRKGALEQVHGSNTRLNVSSRSDTRDFYVSRDQGQMYVLHVNDDDAAAADIVAYLRNDSPDKSMFIRDIHLGTQNAATFLFAFGDSTAASGTGVTPVNLNKASSNAANVTAFGNGAVGGVAASTTFSGVRVGAAGFEEWHQDGLILGQNDNLVITLEAISSTGDIEVDIFFYLA